jgi:hypothetical protein
MLFPIDEPVRRRAKTPHELFVLNLAVFHLLLAPAAIVLKIGVAGFLIPLAASLAVIVFTWLRARRSRAHDPWFVAAHWTLAARRTRILLTVYAICGAILGAGLLVASGIDKKTTQDITLTVFSRVAAAPLLIGVMLGFVLESGALYQAGRGEIPDSLVKRAPPPAGLEPLADAPGEDRQ